jgi:hypothetical protein
MATCCGSNGSPYVQTLFMGASITSYSAQADWGGNGGGLQVELVEDKCAGNARVYVDGRGNLLTTTEPDSFNPPTVGAPVFFYFGGFTYGGILQSWQLIDGADSPRHFRVNIVSPKDIVDGVEIILRHYDGSIFGVPNLENVHGILEASCGACGEGGFATTYPPMGFANGMTYVPAPGYCKVSDAGWKLSSIRAGLLSIINNNLTSYGGLINFRGYLYYLDIAELPWLDDEIRISEENITVGELAAKVCGLAGREYFWEVVPMIDGDGGCNQSGHLGNGPHWLRLRVGSNPWQAYEQSAEDVDAAICTDINDRLSAGMISSAITNSTCVNRYSTGLELRLDKANAFMTGEFRKDVFQMAYSGRGDGVTDTIWPYWGKDYQDNVILGNGMAGNDFNLDEPNQKRTHTFSLPIAHLGIGINTWNVSIPELRCAIASESSWRAWLFNIEPEKYLALFCPGNDININQLNEQSGKFLWGLLTDVIRNDRLDGPKVKPMDLTNLHSNNNLQLMNNKMQQLGKAGAQDGLNAQEIIFKNASTLYQYLKQFATEYYGRQFMVKLPFLCASYDPDAPYSIATNWNPTDGGWCEYSVLGLAQTSPILEYFRTDDARIKCFARFISQYVIRMDRMSKDNIFPISPFEIYVGGNVREIVWVSPTDPRAVIDIGAPVEIENDKTILPEWQLFAVLIDKFAELQGVNKPSKAALDKLFKTPGNDKLAASAANPLLLPVAVAVPLQSDKLVYGPWFVTRTGLKFDFSEGGLFWDGFNNGQTTYERDTGYAPWNFGSMDRMNAIAYKHVAALVGDKYVQERGEITFPGAPTVRLGDLIDAGGPAISQIDVSIGRGNDAITTTLRMKTYTPDFGKLWKARVDAIRRANTVAMRTHRLFAKHSLEKFKGVLERRIDAYIDYINTCMPRHTGKSSLDILSGWVAEDHENSEHARSYVTTSEMRKEIITFGIDDAEQYRRRALVETAGIFRPFSTLPQDKVIEKDDGMMSRFSQHEHPSGWPRQTGEYLTNNIDFYSKEQVPPLFCKEHHLPIVVETLSPFLANGTSATQSLWMNSNGNENKGHDIEYVARDGTYPTHLNVRHPQDNYSEDHWYRAIALRGPLVIAGWGYDTHNKPVPNASVEYPENPKMQFKENWLRRPHDWKCGPVDLRWDEDRKVWTAPSPHKIVRMILMDDIGRDKCAPALLIDDQIQHDVDGEPIDKETFCGKEGYKVTVWNSHNRPIPKGWRITAFYDTTYSKYYVLSHDEFPILQATMDSLLTCDGEATATITGPAGGGSLDECGALTNKKVLLTNPLAQPICAGMNVFVYVNDVEYEGYTDPSPTLEDCQYTCDKIKQFKGVVLQAEFEPECVVTKMELLEFKFWNLDERTDTGNFQLTPQGAVNVYTDAVLCTGDLKVVIPSFEIEVSDAIAEIQGDVTIGGTIDIPAIEIGINVTGLHTEATNTNFTATGTINDTFNVDINNHTGTINLTGTADLDLGTHSHNFYSSGNSPIEGVIITNGDYVGENISVSLGVTATGNTAATVGDVTVNGTAYGVILTSYGTYIGTIHGITDVANISGEINGTFPLDLTDGGCAGSGTGSSTGTYYDLCTEEYCSCRYVWSNGWGLLDGSGVGMCCECMDYAEINELYPDPPPTGEYFLIVPCVPQTHDGDQPTANCLESVVTDGTGECCCQGTVTIEGSITGEHSHTFDGTCTGNVVVTGEIPNLTVNADGEATIPSLFVSVVGTAAGSINTSSQSISTTGTYSNTVIIVVDGQTSDASVTGTVPINFSTDLDLSHTGSVTINKQIELIGTIRIPQLEVSDGDFTGTSEPISIQATGITGTIPGTITVTGITAIIPGLTGTVEGLNGVAVESTAEFIPETCTVQYTVKYRNYWEFYRYELCICSKQIYLETARGGIVCSSNNTPDCTCNCEDLGCGGCGGGSCPTPSMTGGKGDGWFNGIEDIFTVTSVDCGTSTEADPPTAEC